MSVILPAIEADGRVTEIVVAYKKKLHFREAKILGGKREAFILVTKRSFVDLRRYAEVDFYVSEEFDATAISELVDEYRAWFFSYGVRDSK